MQQPEQPGFTPIPGKACLWRSSLTDVLPAVVSMQLKAAAIMASTKRQSRPLSLAGLEISVVKLIVFDMGHVLVSFDWSMVCAGFCRKATIDSQAFRSVLDYVGGLGYETGLVTTEQFLQELNTKIGASLSVDEFHGLWNATFTEDQEMAVLVERLGKTYPLYLLSNTNDSHYQYLQQQFNVARHFKEIILSYVVGYAKPDQRIYQEVLRRSGLEPSECLFIDDLDANVKAAEALGMQTIKFVGVQDLKERLTALGIAH